jgi:hypothetical protein
MAGTSQSTHGTLARRLPELRGLSPDVCGTPDPAMGHTSAILHNDAAACGERLCESAHEIVIASCGKDHVTRVQTNDAPAV